MLAVAAVVTTAVAAATAVDVVVMLAVAAVVTTAVADGRGTRTRHRGLFV
jgi:hypothetical protein